MGWSLSGDAMHEIDRILNTTVTDPVGPEFMAPPPRPQTALAYDSHWFTRKGEASDAPRARKKTQPIQPFPLPLTHPVHLSF